MFKTILIGLLTFACTPGFAQVLELYFPEHRFRIDPYDHIIVVQSDSITAYSDLTNYAEINLTLDNFEFQFTEIPDNLVFTSEYAVTNGTADYHLFFTQLPLLKIQTSANVTSQIKVPAQFLYADAYQILIGSIGIEIRGNTSAAYPKKSYDIEFREAAGSEISVDVQFGNLRNDDDWVLDGMYNEPLRLRSHISYQLWLDIHTPFYAGVAPDAVAGVGGYYVELFLNGHYSGIYLLSEQVDRKLLDLEHFDGSIQGELFKGDQLGEATVFNSLPAIDNSSRLWGGFEMKYPNVEDTTNWQNLYHFVDFVLNATDTAFTTVWDRFNYQNYLDYFIFLNLTRASDNTGKNIYIARYDSATPYFYVPWDLDGTFGLWWDGTNENITDDILTNGFMDRVINTDVGNYTTDVNARWAELRASVFHTDYLIARFQYAYDLLKANNVYTRETLVYPNYPFDQESFDYIVDWIQNRMDFLDIYFDYQPVSVKQAPMKRKLLIYPNPVRHSFHILYDDKIQNQPFQIYNTSGKVVKSGIYTGEALSISDLSAGFYVLHVGAHVGKILIN